jgi:hypothetical protein
MPHGAAALRKYVRYYYAVASSAKRAVKGIYIEKVWFKSNEIPAGDVVVVGGEADIPIPNDAECSVVFVEYISSSSLKVDASCSTGLFEKS